MITIVLSKCVWSHRLCKYWKFCVFCLSSIVFCYRLILLMPVRGPERVIKACTYKHIPLACTTSGISSQSCQNKLVQLSLSCWSFQTRVLWGDINKVVKSPLCMNVTQVKPTFEWCDQQRVKSGVQRRQCKFKLLQYETDTSLFTAIIWSSVGGMHDPSSRFLG